MKWLKRITIAIAVLLLIAAAGLWWLLGTGAGLRFALARGQAATHGALQWQQASGSLLAPRLGGLRYDDGKGTQVAVGKLQLQLRFWPLLARRVHADTLVLDGVTVVLPKSTNDSTEGGSISLKPPMDLLLDRVHVDKLRISQAGQALFAADSLALAGHWTHAGLAIDQLQLRAPDGHAELAGQLAFARHLRGNGKADFAWTLGELRYAGQLVARSDGALAQLTLSLQQPMDATVQLQLAQTRDADWKARLAVPRFDLATLTGKDAPRTASLQLQGHGNRQVGALDGELTLDDYRLQLQPLQMQLAQGGKQLVLTRLSLRSPQTRGQLDAHGSLQLDARPLAGQLSLQWHDLLLPGMLTGLTLHSSGQLTAGGSARRYHADGRFTLGTADQSTQFALALDGTPQGIDLHAFTAQQAHGALQAKGRLQLQPVLAWQVDASATRFDPGQWLAGWPGALDFALTSHGQLSDHGIEATLDLPRLAGQLRGRTLDGRGQLHLSPQRVLDGQLRLAAGNSSLLLRARPGRGNDADLELAIASLGDWLPAASGRLDGQFNLRGMPPRLAINGHLDGSALVWQQQRARSLQLIVGLPDISRIKGKLQLDAGDAVLGGLTFPQLHLLAEGSPGDHRLTVDARGGQLGVQLDLHGAMQGRNWRGTLSTLNLVPQGLPSWRLQSATPLGWREGVGKLDELCLSAGEPQLCLHATRSRAGQLDASFRLHALPLALLQNAAGAADLPVRAEGSLSGEGQLQRSARGVLTGSASLQSDHGSLSWLMHEDVPPLDYRQLALHAELDAHRQQFSVHAALDHDGLVDGQLSLVGKQETMDGTLALRLGRLDFLQLFDGPLATVRGTASGDFRLGGTLARPALSGRATLDHFAAEVPGAGLTLSAGQLDASAIDAQHWRVDGSVHSGDGTLAVAGVLGLGPDTTSRLTISGAHVTAADIPAATLVASPDLQLLRDASGLSLSGAITLDRADVDLDKLPGAGAAKASPDVVVLGRTPPPASPALPITASVTVALGQQAHLRGMGLNGQLGGTLTVDERPGQPATGQGQITVRGSYKAYGQDLAIERGQLLFAGTPLDNPGLAIRAVRKLNPNATVDEGQEVGLDIGGTARRPVLTVFSNPPMEPSDALAWLVTGKPLSQVSSGEGDMLGSAAQALGSAAGNLLAKSIGNKLGLDDIGVAGNAALGGNSAFTVGKYLSPRLYVSYGVGLFEPGEVVTLRYRLSHRWNLEAQSASSFDRASLNYRLEK